MSSGVWRVPEEPEQLAGYVIPELYAGTWLLPHDAFDLREKPLVLAQRIYEKLCQESITYEVEALSSDGQHGQLIRQPWHVLRGQKVANCLELSLIYAGLCLSAHLRTLLVTCRLATGQRHALVLLTPWLSNQGELKLLPDGRPGARGWSRDVTWEQLREPVKRGELCPVEPTCVTSTMGPADFETARTDGLAKLTVAEDIVLLDVYQLQNKPAYRVRARDDALQLPRDFPHNPRFFSMEIVAKYAKHLGDPPPALDLETLKGMRLDDSRAESTRAALVRALEVKPVFEAVDGTKPSADRLKGIYSRNIGWDPSSGIDEMMLVEAADVDDGERPDALVRFVLAVAAENERTDHPELKRWLETERRQQRVQKKDIEKIIEENKTIEKMRHVGDADDARYLHWAIVYLDHHEPCDQDRSGGSGGWDVRIEVRPWLGSGRSFRGHCRHDEKLEELETTLVSLFNELTSSIRLGDFFVVDIVAPRRLLDERLEHRKLVGGGDGADPQPLSPLHRPRLRWDGHFYRHVQGIQADRERHLDWRLKPEPVPGKTAKDKNRLNVWLAQTKIKAIPVLVAESVDGPADPLLTILGAGQGRVLWYPDGIRRRQVRQIRHRWTDASRDAPDLPETLVAGFVPPDVPVVIWNDLEGRVKQPLPRARPAGPPEAEER